MPLYSCCPLTGPHSLWAKPRLPQFLLPIGFWSILHSRFYCVRPYSRSIPCAKSADSLNSDRDTLTFAATVPVKNINFRICTSDLRVVPRSSSYFSPRGIPRIVLRSWWNAYEHMGLILARLCFSSLYSLLLAQFSHFLPDLFLSFSILFFSAMFRRKYDMVLAAPL